MATLRYRSKGGSLTFMEAGRRRRVGPGEIFEVEEAVAGVLLSSEPQLERFVPEPEPDAFAIRRALVARAKELGVTASGKSEDIEKAIAAEEARLAELNQGGLERPADDPDAVAATGEAGPSPSDDTQSSAPGAITLGDLPDGARLAPSQETK